MVATVWAISGTAIRCPSRPITPRAVVSPRIAVAIGMPIATTVPKVKVRISIAARIPIRSLVEVSLGESTDPIDPPPWTSIPAFLPGSAASITRCACGLGQLAGADLEQSRDERRLLVLRDLGSPVLVKRADGTGDEGDLLDRLVGVRDRGLIGRVGHLALGDVEDDRIRSVLLRREPGLEQVGGLLAAGAGERDVVVGLGSDSFHEQRHAGRANDPEHNHDHRVGGHQAPEPVEQSWPSAATSVRDDLQPDLYDRSYHRRPLSATAVRSRRVPRPGGARARRDAAPRHRRACT